MDLKKPSNWIKEICLFVLLVIEVIFTFLSFFNKWNQEISMALLFADVLTLFNGFLSVVNKFDNEHHDMQNKIAKEHTEIKGAIDLYKDIEELTYVSCFEGSYVQSQKISGTEIWVISNCIDEPDEVLQQIFNNLVFGVKYYYVIPNDRTCENDLKNTVNRLSDLRKRSRKVNLAQSSIRYIKDDLFDFLPTSVVDILYYCNPNSTDYNSNMKIFYSFQSDIHSGIFYKPISLDNEKRRAVFNKMLDWKKRNWIELTIQ